ncbi:Gfo/Idh/MocA family oxidoreductase [Palleronia rufa]|uniref:Gfo/Idh/MocA family protein n=1 Tax=Palleronia rufa TaxID=1530186 RepID=UPI000AB5EB07
MSSMPIALAGIGKIARDEHIPALNDSPDWHLAATISRNAEVEGVRAHEDMDAFLADPGDIRTVSLALPPAPRFAYAKKAIAAGLNVMLEKPPATTLGECRILQDMARDAGVTLYASWHSRMGAAVEEAARRLRGAALRRLHVDWREDVRQFHPDQDWVWEAGNLGVFDPGINAFSILVAILDGRVHLTRAEMVVPDGRETPISADLEFGHGDGARVSARLDWGHKGAPVWNMEIETDRESFVLTRSGTGIDDGQGEIDLGGETAEYALVYARLAELVRGSGSDTDLRPLEMAADAFLLASRSIGPPFEW